MKTPSPNPLRTGQSAFTLIELIGVLAIMSLLAAVITPNVLRMIERSAVRTEAETLHNLGEQVKLHLRDKGTVPTNVPPPATPNWTTQLGIYSDLSPADIATNKRLVARLYVLDLASVPAPRAMIISSMRTGVALGPAATTNAFAAVWNWNPSDLIAANVPLGWNAWTPENVEYLVIERVNLSSVYHTDLKSIPLTLNNKTPVTGPPAVAATDASYVVVLANGTVQARQPILAGKSVILPPLHPRDRIDLYRVLVGGSPDSSYVLSTSSSLSFDFNGTNWLPK